MKLIKLLSFFVLLAASFAFGFGWRDLRVGQMPPPEAFARLAGQEAETRKLTPTQEFRQAFQTIASRYYKPVKEADLKFAGMHGLLGALGDPHTNFMEPRISEQFALETRGDFVGVGARLSPDPLGARVVTVFPKGPAFSAGMKPNDVVTAVDGRKVSGTELDKIVTQIRGEEGTRVTLTVFRTGAPKPVTLRITRAKVIVPTVESRVLPEKIGFVSVSAFSETTVSQFDEALRSMVGKGLSGLVIDLRGNPGGRLDAAVDMLSRFVSGKVVVRMRYRGTQEEVAVAPSGRRMNLPNPVVVLINEESASAAEIFAGVLQDYRVATLVGEHTYGKASVQQIFPTGDGASAKITVARYYLPSGRDISRKVDEHEQYLSGGLKADLEVPLAFDAVIGDPKTDNQLVEAIKLIQSKRAADVDKGSGSALKE